MRKFLVLTFVILLSASVAFARNQRKAAIMVGFMPSSPGNIYTTLPLNLANTWLRYKFVPEATLTLTKVEAYVSAVGGSLDGDDLRLEILKDISGTCTPAVTVQDAGDTVTLTAHGLANGSLVRFTTGGNGITADTDYWVCGSAANTFTLDTVGATCINALAITGNGSDYVRYIVDASATVTATPAGALWTEWTGFTAALTGGVQYNAVFRNMAAVPGTNYPTFRFGNQTTWPLLGYTWRKEHTTDAGATWGTAIHNNALGFRLEYTDGTFEGIPIEWIGASGDRVYAAREVGVVFTTPANATMNVRCVGMGQLAEVGTPTGQARIRLYTGAGANPTLIDTTTSTWVPSAVEINYYIGCFSTTRSIVGGTTTRVVLGETANADAAGNYYQVPAWAVQNTAASKALMPFDGTLQETYTMDGVTFSDTSTAIVPFMLLLDTEGPFAAGAASGGGTGRVIAQ